MEQNIKLVNKINEVNHDYQTMRVKAKRRINRRASLHAVERRAKERIMQRSLGVESYLGGSRRGVIFWGVITLGFWAVVAYFVWITQ